VHVRVPLPAREASLVMLEPGAVEGVLTEKGALPKLGAWVVEVSLQWFEGRVIGPLPDLERIALPDERGAFKLAGLRPGKYVARATKSLSAVRSAGTFYDQVVKQGFSWFEQESTEFTVESGKTTTIAVDTERTVRAVDGPSAQVTGTVTIDGRAAEGFKVMSYSEQRLSATVDAAGRFDLGLVREGEVYLQLFDPASKQPWESQLWSGQLRIRANQDRNLTIDLRLVVVEGTVWTPAGQPAANVGVHAHGAPAGAGDAAGEGRWCNLQTTTDGQGHFRFDKAAAATYTVMAEDDKLGRGQVSGLVVAAGESKSVEIRMQKTYSISGKIDLTPIGEARGQWLWCHFQPTDAKRASDLGAKGRRSRARECSSAQGSCRASTRCTSTPRSRTGAPSRS
jgi:hypothetical protein